MIDCGRLCESIAGGFEGHGGIGALGAQVLRFAQGRLGEDGPRLGGIGLETQYNYADVAYLLDQIGVPPTNTVGGFLYDPPDNPQGWEQHEAGIGGRV